MLFRKIFASAVLLLLSSGIAAAQECPPGLESPIGEIENTVTGWAKYDMDTVRRADGTTDHGKSAKENLYAIKHDWHRLTHWDTDETVDDLINGVPVLGVIIAVVSMPILIVMDVLDIVVQPAAMIKDLSDAALHGVMSVFR